MILMQRKLVSNSKIFNIYCFISACSIFYGSYVCVDLQGWDNKMLYIFLFLYLSCCNTGTC